MKSNVFLFAIAMILAGTIGVFVTEAGVGAYPAVFLRSLIACPLLGLYCWKQNLLRPSLLRSPSFRYVLAGGVALVFNWVFLFQAFELSSITLGIVGYYTAPFFLLGLGTVFLGESITRAAMGWTLMAFLGLLAIVIPGAALPTQSNNLGLGLGSALVAACLYAGVILFGKKVQGISPYIIAFLQTGMGILLLLPFVWQSIFTSNILTSNIQWSYVIALGAIHTALLYILFYRAISSVPVRLIAPLSFLDPLVAILCDVALYHSRLSPPQILGAGAILVAAYAMTNRQSLG